MWKKALIAFGACMLLVYLGGWFYFSYHYYPKTKINSISAGGKKPEDIFKKEKEQIQNYSLTIHELTKDESVKGVVEIKNIDYYQNTLKKQKAYFWPAKFYNNYEWKSDEVYVVNEKNLKDQLSALQYMNENRKAVNAKLKYDESSKQYKEIPEEYGSIEDKDTVYQEIKKAALLRSSDIDLKEYYKKPKITTKSDKFIEAKEKLNKYLTTKITYQRNDTKLVLDADTIHEFLCWNKKFKVWISKDSVHDWVENNVSKKFNNIGMTRTIHSPGSGTFKVSGGTYGYVVYRDKETEKLIKQIKEGTQETREPVYYREGKLKDNFVDINLSKQQLYVVKNGKVKVSSPIVSGCIATGHGTKTGVYFVEYKTTNYHMRKYNVHVDYWMPFDTGVGVGMHDATWRGSFGGSIYRSNGSHGCINLPHSKAREIYQVVPTDYPVVVHY